jgi:hypothetical protein
VIDYHTYCQIHALHTQQRLHIVQIDAEVGLNPETVSKW